MASGIDAIQKVEELTPMQIKMLTRVFDTLKDKNGNIPIDELEGVLEQLGAGVTKQGLQTIINEIDPFGSGIIDFHSFATLAAKFILVEDPNKLRDELRQAFLLFDREENGYITTDQLREILWELDPTINVPDMDNIIEEIDADGSGTVDFDEKTWGTQSADTLLTNTFIEFLAVMMGTEEEEKKTSFPDS